ncbi:hypothetical protein B0A48_03401 [Cryoendolithus antarcticus]|uniref:FAD/NAD(P)-binding domain-containing protein n=1 Tax=Cryoendolithus antarcticus TaxID=1507870 RepID=A0A1V8TK42_9PEZI|nr:hypothetical protein B0A48_03401 [Cryoendolithus antarcticus]
MATSDPLSSLEGDMLDVAPGVKVVNGDIKATDHLERLPNVANGTNGSMQNGHTNETVKHQCDVLVVGAGFSGITAIHRFRKLGLKVKCFEAGGDFGGVWYWNRYPGARVDSEAPFYQLNIPEVYRDFTFTQRFPGHVELRRYMAHIDNVLELRKDVTFDAQVISAVFDEAKGLWTVKTATGHEATCKYLMLASGLLHRKYTPDLPGLDRYKGKLVHSASYPEDLDCTGKKVGLVGAGATAVQITQELGKEAKELTVFLRRPSYCLPMGQRKMTEEEQTQWKSFYPSLFSSGRDSRVGFPADPKPQGALDVSAEERNAWFENTWKRGGFHYQLSAYSDTLINKESNRVVYDFWASKVRERLTDPKKQAIMAPKEPPYFFGTKRNPLENDYYEVLNQSNVQLVDLKASPLKTFEETGMRMEDGVLHDFDVVVLATGFDSFTGSLTTMGLKNTAGVDLKDLWKDGVHTFLGLTISGFPNMFMSYTPQAPTALSNGTTIIEAQVETIVDMVAKMERENVKSIEAKKDAEAQWKKALTDMANMTLLPYTSSWWDGSNIPGKKAEGMTYIGGINNYEKECRATMDGWKGFEVVAA